MPIVPDTKDWTWVLERPCPECGLDTRAIAPADIGGMLRSNTEIWHEILGEGEPASLRRRPDEDRWSELEYACHVRDVFRLFDYRLERMLAEDHPQFENWDQDATAIAERYGEQDPEVVATELADAAKGLCDRLDTVAGDDWRRRGRRGDGAEFTISTFARYLLHDPVHHLHDVGRGTATDAA